MHVKSKKWLYLLLLVLAVAVCLGVAPIRTFLGSAISTLSSSGLSGIIAFIRQYGPYAAVISFLLMVLQSVLAPIPAFLITLSNAAIFGWVWGSVLSWSSAMVGAALCFGIARLLGRDVVEKLARKGLLNQIDAFFKRYGKHSILIARLLPFISFDIVSYAAGLTSMGFWGFLLATGIGQLPATLVYSYVGGTLSGGWQMALVGILCLMALSVAIYVGRKVYEERHQSR